MDAEDDREEYVTNESGRIWTGTTRHVESMAWNFGQFEDVCLEAALYLLDKAELKDGARSNPVLIARSISATVSMSYFLFFYCNRCQSLSIWYN